MTNVLLAPHQTNAMAVLDNRMGERVEELKKTKLSTLMDTDDCLGDLLPWLAWALSVDVWDSNWSEAEKRGVIRASLEVHRRKGTVAALREALAAFDVSIEVEEWWQRKPHGEPYTFFVTVPPQNIPVTAGKIAAIRQTINNTKNERSHLARLEVRQGIKHALHLAAVGKGFTRLVHTETIRAAGLRMGVMVACALAVKQYSIQKGIVN